MTASTRPFAGPWLLVPLDPENAEQIGRLRPGQRVTIAGGMIACLPGLAREAPPFTPPPRRPARRASRGSAEPRSKRQVSYELLGELRTAPTANDAMVDILKAFEAVDPGFLERLAPLAAGRSRNHIARTPANVYPHRPDLAERCVTELVPGWFVGTNIANREKTALLKRACEVLGLVFGRDLKIWLM